MPVIDLTRYIVAASGTWTDPTKDQNLFNFTLADTYAPDHLMLRWAGDFLALTGPLRVRVTVQSENMTLPLAYVSNLVPQYAATLQSGTSFSTAAGAPTNAFINTGAALYESALSRFGQGALGLQASTIYTYILDIAAGQAWPFSLSEQLDALRLQNARLTRFEQLGNNLGYRVIIEAAFAISKCVPVNTTSDLPCDFAVANQPNTASFFPSACEPCDSTITGLPPSTGTVSLIVPPADGGCVRTRFFNGMFITREDLETEQRYLRLKSKLHNRASGAGVVWGLNVAKQGSAVCVMPGYGVDCCGNDLALTSVYQVDIAALLADPAAASLSRFSSSSRLNSQRFSLLLEYVECPADPRPVHGDPCSPDASRCEMSRIRESVRLRLVPPCDYDAAKESAPIQKFLDEVRTLRAQYPLGNGVSGSASDYAPFQLRVAINGNAATSIRPSPSTTTVNIPSNQQQAITSVAVEVQPDQLWTFVRGTVSGSVNGPVGVQVNPSGSVDLSLAQGFGSSSHQVTYSTATGAPLLSATLIFRLANWQMQSILANESDPAPSGDLTFTLQINPNAGLANNTLVETPIAVNPINLAADPCGQPCGPANFTTGGGTTVGSPCAGYATTTGTFQSPPPFIVADPNPVLPWLHTDPTDESRAGDPKALVMGALGAWLAQMLVREQFGTANSVNSTRREIAQGIYRIAWLLLFGVPQKADPAVLACTLQRLLESLCDELLWSGPQCRCDPHGVVIGCAVVQGGTIQQIDVFGGRRYVMHYPLLEHWGAQFGIAPLDITLTRFFSKLCCVSSLRAATVDQPSVGPLVTELGAGYITVGEPDAVAAQLKGKSILNVRRASTPEMIVAALTLIGTTRATPEPSYTAMTLADLVADQTVMLLVPVAPTSSTSTSSGPTNQNPVPSQPSGTSTGNAPPAQPAPAAGTGLAGASPVASAPAAPAEQDANPAAPAKPRATRGRTSS